MTQWLMAVAAGYLVGSIPFAYLLTKVATGEDVRRLGSGNVGATNVLRRAGWRLGLTTLALDIGKGAVAVWLGAQMAQGAVTTPGPPGLEGSDLAMLTPALAGVAAVIGHVYPAWLRLAGGKGVATAAGVFAVLAPAVTAGAVIGFVVIVWRTRYVSLGSITGAVLVPVLTAFDGAPWPVWSSACVVSALILFKHRDNLARLRGGREHRLGERTADVGRSASGKGEVEDEGNAS